MEITFDCECGTEVTDRTRGDDGAEFQYLCDGCETLYAVTITPISGTHA